MATTNSQETYTMSPQVIGLIALGGLFVLVTLLLPRGVAGLWRRREEGDV